MSRIIDSTLESQRDADEAAHLEDQLAAFFEAHYARLTRLATLVCHERVPVEDAVQAAMEQAWRRRHTLQDASRIRSWLDRIVVREAIRLNRRRWWTERPHAPDEEGAAMSDTRAGVDPVWVAMAVAFRKLPIEQRAAVALHLYAGHSVEETAAVMGASYETTRSRLRLARGRLRHELRDEDER
jgi:RNA polymerase sigma factor (sigma-70 family)